jgi:maltooligosyltrehalose trehalohydrolase
MTDVVADPVTSGAWALERGATLLPGGGVRFAVWAPRAQRVDVRVHRDGGAADHPLAREADGIFAAAVADAGAGTDYQFVLDGGAPLPDPVSRAQPADVHGPSRVVDPAAHRWGDAGWRAPALADLVLYELHVGTFSDAGTFDGAIPHLAELRDLGVTAIEIMPVAEFPGARNWGYDGVHLYAPEWSYGGPDGLKRLVDAAHAAGLAVVLDVVYNHLGPEGNYLGAYGPYFTSEARTPWGDAVNFGGADSAEVRRFVIDNAAYWVTEYHIDGLRLDAIHGIVDASEPHLLAELVVRVRAAAAALGREVLLIAESDLNDARVVRPAAERGYGFDAQWSDDFHHAVHVALTGETRGYYGGFERPGLVAAALRDPFLRPARAVGEEVAEWAPQPPATTGIPRERFVVAVQNHDQVGNRAAGDRLATLVPPEALRLAAALMLLSPYVPLLFMGEEYGETRPFQYFVSHTDPALVDAVRHGRRREFAGFGWGEAVPDPQDEATFARSKLDRARAATPEGRALRALYADLLRLRRTEPALRPGGARVAAVALALPGVVAQALTPHGGGDPLVAVYNTGAAPQQLRSDLARGAGSAVMLSTSDPRYGGPGAAHLAPDYAFAGAGALLDLPAHSAVLLRSSRSAATPRAGGTA